MTGDEEQHSLDYIEDPYFNPHDSTSTPSLDQTPEQDYLTECDVLDNELDLFDLRQLDFDDLTSLGSLHNDESVNVEAEFFNVKRANAIIKAFFKKDFKRQVRVTYCDLTKPYLVKLPKDNTFRKYLDISTNNEEAFAAGDFQNNTKTLTEEEEAQHKIWREELAQMEEEIATLRTVLGAKVKRATQLKQNLGITVWKEVTDDINQGIKNVKESNVYHSVESKVEQVTKAVTDAPLYQAVETKVGEVSKAVTEAPIYQAVEQKVEQVTKAVTDAPIYQKTTSLIGGFAENITGKLGQMRHSESFRSIEERVGSAYENVKTKVVSRSGSQQSLNEAGRSRSGSVATSPTIPENTPME